MTPSVIHVHLENLSSKPEVFRLSPELARETRRQNKDLAKRARFTVGEDFANLERRLKTAVVLVTSSDAVRSPHFPRDRLAEVAPNLRFVHLIGAGIESVLPLDWLPRGVQLTNNSGVHVDKAREFFLMALVALNARLPAIVWNQRRAHWEQIFTPLIRGKTLTVIGLGDIGRSAIEAARILGLNVLGVSRSGKKVPRTKRVYRSTQIETAVRSADFIALAVPLTPETRNLVDRKLLEKTKGGVGIINVGRAGTMDYVALARLLRTGHVSGAILDVFSPEPLPQDSELWTTPNLIITPHVSSDDLDTYMIATMNLVCDNVRRLLSGRALANVVDPEKGY